MPRGRLPAMRDMDIAGDIQKHISEMVVGRDERIRFLLGDKLSPREAILAHCFVCREGYRDKKPCRNESCSLYPYRPKRPLKA